MIILTIIYGTRGDVIPILHIVRNLLENDGGLFVFIITHSEFAGLVPSILHSFHARVSLRYSNSKPIWSDSPIHRLDNDAEQPLTFLKEFVSNYDINVIIANLFALEAWLLALSLTIPCIFIHPHVPPVSEPPKFIQVTIKTAYAGCNHQRYYMEWLWPTLSNRFDKTKKLLNIPLDPLDSHFRALHATTPTPHIIIAASPSVLKPVVHSSLCSVVGWITNTSVFPLDEQDIKYVLAGLMLITRNKSCDYYPNCISLVDFVSIAHRDQSALILVDFGSMTDLYGSYKDISYLILCLLQLMINSNYSLILLSYGFDHMQRALKKCVSYLGSCENCMDFIHLIGSKICFVDEVLLYQVHRKLVKSVSTVLHHGGAGTCHLCLMSGTPQVILPIMHDQFTWQSLISGSKIDKELLDALLPEAEPQTLLFPSNSELEACAFSYLESELAKAVSPSNRLAVGCRGRKLRDDPSEQGMRNTLAIVASVVKSLSEPSNITSTLTDSVAAKCDSDDCEWTIFPLITLTTEDSDSPNHNHAHPLHSATDSALPEYSDYDDIMSDCQWPVQLAMATHPQSMAAEETLFIFDEIFCRKAYQCPTDSRPLLQPGDLVVDIGANVGMFSLWVELMFSSLDALRIIAVEPAEANARLLRKNLGRYAPTAHVVQCAVGTKRQPPDNREDKLVFFPHLPGNSCLQSHASEKLAMARRVLNPLLTSIAVATTSTSAASAIETATDSTTTTTSVSATVGINDCTCDRTGTRNILDGAREERCVVKTLDEIIAECSLFTESTSYPPRIALLKVDVEGSEVEVLRDGISDSCWGIIDQVVVETNSRRNAREIVDMLEQKGFINIFYDSNICITAIDGGNVNDLAPENSFEEEDRVVVAGILIFAQRL